MTELYIWDLYHLLQRFSIIDWIDVLIA